MGTIVKAFTEGGFWMWPILGIQITAIAIIIERGYFLFIRRGVNASARAGIFEEDIKRGELKRVMKKAESYSRNSAIRRVVEAGTQAAMSMGGREEIQSKMDEVLYAEQTRIESRIEFLSMLGNVATLMGLLGTIVGMIRAFSAISQADQLTKAAMLAAGISEAMHATAYGLIVAIPTLIMYSVLQNRANKINDDLTKGAFRIYNLLAFHYESVPSKRLVNR